MAAASATPRAQRSAIMASRLSDVDGFRFAVDCRSASTQGERAFLIAELAARPSALTATDAEVLRRMRSAHGCGGRVLAAWLETGPVLGTTAYLQAMAARA